MPTCRIFGGYFQSLGIMRHEKSCIEKHSPDNVQKKGSAKLDNFSAEKLSKTPGERSICKNCGRKRYKSEMTFQKKGRYSTIYEWQCYENCDWAKRRKEYKKLHSS
jgi:hypothetical protein